MWQKQEKTRDNILGNFTKEKLREMNLNIITTITKMKINKKKENKLIMKM